MMPYAELIEQIRCLLAQPPAAVGATQITELARRYAEACRAVGERLNRCDECLSKGLRSEAIQTAEQAPALLDAAVTLDFPERAAWIEACRRHGAETSAELSTSQISRLNREYADGATVEPLLKVYRKVVHVGTLEEKISVLRKLQALDGKTPVWRQNLLPLETEQIRRLMTAAQELNTLEDIPRLNAIVRELRETPWGTEAPADAIARLEAKLQGLNARQLKATMDQLCQTLGTLVKAGDAAGLAEPLAAWSRLGDAAMATATPTQMKTMEHANGLLEKQQTEKRRRQEFQQTVGQVMALLEQPAPKRCELETVLARIENSEGLTPPPAVMTRARERLAELTRLHERRLRLLLVTGLVVLVIAGAALLVLVQQKIRAAKVHNQTTELEALIKARQYPKAASELTKFLQATPWAAKDPKLRQFKSSIADGCAQLSKEAEEFDRLRIELERIRNAQFNAARETIEPPLNRLEAIANNEEQRLFLDRWKADRRAYERQQQEAREKTFASLLQGILGQLEHTEEIATRMTSADAQVTMNELNSQVVVAVRQEAGVSPELKAQLADARQQVAKLGEVVKARVERDAKTARGRIEAQAALQAMWKNIPTGALPMRSYAELLAKAAELNAPDDTVAEPWATSEDCARAEMHAKLAEWLSSSGFAFTGGIPTGLTDYAKKTIAWNSTLRQRLAQCQKAEARRTALSELLCAPVFTDLRILEIKARHGEHKNTLRLRYYTGAGKMFSDGAGNRTFSCEQAVYSDTAPSGYVLQRTPISDDYWIFNKSVETPVFAAHNAPLNAFLRVLKETPNVELAPFLLKQAECLGRNGQICPSLRAGLVKELLTAAETIAPATGEIPSVRSALNRLKSRTLQNNWLEDADASVIAEMADFATWGRFADAEQAYRNSLKLVETALTRRVAICGVVKQVGADPALALLPGAWRELWTVSVNATGAYAFRIVAVLNPQTQRYQFLAGEKALLKKGLPLLSPADGQSTYELVKTLGNPAQLPAAWPVNGRQAP
jgi:hypothetical protein